MPSDRSEHKKNRRLNKTTNEKPISIPLEFEDALEALLNTSPSDKDGSSGPLHKSAKRDKMVDKDK